MKFVFWWAIKYNGYTVMMVYLQCVLPLLFLFIISSFLRKRLYFYKDSSFMDFRALQIKAVHVQHAMEVSAIAQGIMDTWLLPSLFIMLDIWVQSWTFWSAYVR